jgi:glycosyltransferase involved in cell wall biosynthesis
MNKPNFSIIIPTRFRPKELNDVFTDLSVQTEDLSQTEVLLFNDGNDAKTEQIAKQPWPFKVHYFSSMEKTNSCRSRNICLDHAQGEWIIFLDDDVRFNKQFLSWIKEQTKTYSVFTSRITKPVENQKKRGPIKYILQKYFRGKTLPILGFFVEGYEEKTEKPVCVDHLVGAVMIMKHDLIKFIRFDEWIGEGNGFLDDTDFCKKIQMAHNVLEWYIPTFDVLHLQASSGGNREHDQKKWYYYYQAHKIYFFKKYYPGYIFTVLISSFAEAVLRSIQKRTNLIPTYVRSTRYGLSQTI